MKREAEAPQQGPWSADQERPSRSTSLVSWGTRRNFSQVIFDDEDEEARVCGSAEKREISKHMAKLSIQPLKMKVRRS